MLLLLPLGVLFVCERLLDVQLDPTDRSLIHFMLVIFFLAYLFILGIDAPVHRLQDWRTQLEKRLSSALEKKEPPSRDDDSSCF